MAELGSVVREGVEVKRIPLTQGQFALVDDADYEKLSQWKWYALWAKNTQSFYAMRRDGSQRVRMHRFILGLNTGDPRQTDHRNRDTLDNRRSNLRIASASQNAANRRRQMNSKTKVKGVHFERDRQKWRARICVNGKYHDLGRFNTLEAASSAYKSAAESFFGEFARSA